MDYVDLMLVHWPNPDQDRYVDALRGLEAVSGQGGLRAIGTSNFKPAHLQRVLDETGITPDVNQIQAESVLDEEGRAGRTTPPTASSPSRIARLAHRAMS